MPRLVSLLALLCVVMAALITRCGDSVAMAASDVGGGANGLALAVAPATPPVATTRRARVVASTPTPVPAPPAATDTTLTFVVRDASGRAVSGAGVRLVDAGAGGAGTSAPIAEACTDLDGRATVHVPSAALLCAEADKEGVGRSPRVIVEPGPAGDTVLTLRATATIRGRVLHPDDRPVPGASVRAALQGMRLSTALPRSSYSVRADEDGRFTLEVEPDVRLVLLADADAAHTSPVSVDTGVASVHDVVLRLPGAWTITGLVVDSAGRPARGYVRAQREVLTDALDEPEPMRARLDREGRFHLAVGGPGRCLLQAFAADTFSDATPVEVSDARPHPEVTLRLPPTLPVAGRVVLADGRPAAGVRMRLVATAGPDQQPRLPPDELAGHTPLATTDDDGAFSIAAAASGITYDLVLLANGRDLRVGTRRQGVRAGDRNLLLRVSDAEARGAVLTLDLVFADDGTPVCDVEATLVYDKAGGSGRTVPLASGLRGGRIVLPPMSLHMVFGLALRPTRGGVEASAPFYLWPIELSGDETRRLSLPRAANLTVRVLDRDGRPRPGLCVGCNPALRQPGPQRSLATTGADGTTALGRLAPGEAVVQVGVGGRLLLQQEVTLSPGTNPDLVLRLP